MALDQSAKDKIFQLFSSLGIDQVLVEIKEEDDVVKIDVGVPEEDAGIYIGRYASVLDSIQLIISLFINKEEPRLHVLLDIGGYRGRREETLKAMVERIAEEVMATGEPRALPPISSTERRQVHLMFQDHADLTTLSQGQGENRRLFISKKAA